jgi:hypothetical protein
MVERLIDLDFAQSDRLIAIEIDRFVKKFRRTRNEVRRRRTVWDC